MSLENVDGTIDIQNVVSSGQIKTSYESNINTNAFTDAEKAKLEALGVNSVNTKTGDVVLETDDISDASSENKFISSEALEKLNSLPESNNIVTTVNGLTGNVNLSSDDVLTAQELLKINTFKNLKADGGLVGDGSDESVLAQDFFDNLPDGSWVVVPAGTYNIGDAVLENKNNIVITGESHASELVNHQDTNSFAAVLNVRNSSSVIIQRLCFDARNSQVANVDKEGVFVTNGVDVMVSMCVFKDVRDGYLFNGDQTKRPFIGHSRLLAPDNYSTINANERRTSSALMRNYLSAGRVERLDGVYTNNYAENCDHGIIISGDGSGFIMESSYCYNTWDSSFYYDGFNNAIMSNLIGIDNGKDFCKAISFKMRASSTVSRHNEINITGIQSVADGFAVTATGHSFEVGDKVYIEGTTNYNGYYTISGLNGSDVFNIIKQGVFFSISESGTASQGIVVETVDSAGAPFDHRLNDGDNISIVDTDNNYSGSYFVEIQSNSSLIIKNQRTFYQGDLGGDPTTSTFSVIAKPCRNIVANNLIGQAAGIVKSDGGTLFNWEIENSIVTNLRGNFYTNKTVNSSTTEGFFLSGRNNQVKGFNIEGLNSYLQTNKTDHIGFKFRTRVLNSVPAYNCDGNHISNFSIKSFGTGIFTDDVWYGEQNRISLRNGTIENTIEPEALNNNATITRSNVTFTQDNVIIRNYRTGSGVSSGIFVQGVKPLFNNIQISENNGEIRALYLRFIQGFPKITNISIQSDATNVIEYRNTTQSSPSGSPFGGIINNNYLNDSQPILGLRFSDLPVGEFKAGYVIPKHDNYITGGHAAVICTQEGGRTNRGLRADTTTYYYNDVVSMSDGNYYRAISFDDRNLSNANNGDSASTEPSLTGLAVGDTVVDGVVTFKMIATSNAIFNDFGEIGNTI